MARDASMDGIYVIRTSLSEEAMLELVGADLAISDSGRVVSEDGSSLYDNLLYILGEIVSCLHGEWPRVD